MVVLMERECDQVGAEEDELRAFLLVLRRALLLIVRYIETRYLRHER